MGKLRGLAVIAMAGVCAALPASASAGTITVNSFADQYNTNDAACALREAVQATNTETDPYNGCDAQGSLGASDTIILPAGVYTLTRSGAPDFNNVNGSVDVDDGNGSTLTITGNGAIIDASVPADRGMYAAPMEALVLDGVSIRGANTAEEGGGLAADGTLTVSNGAFYNNTARAGAGIRVGPDVATFTNVTVSGNTSTGAGANDGGAGVFAFSSTMWVNSTIAGNSATAAAGTARSGGIRQNAGTATIRNTILAGNSDASGTSPAPDCAGAVTSAGNSVLGSASNCTFTGVPSDLAVGTNPLLGPLADNGGGSLTRALLPGSPAIDKGASCPSRDQRGVARPIGPACDIGAFEAPLPALVTLTPVPAAAKCKKKRKKKGKKSVAAAKKKKKKGCKKKKKGKK